MYITRLEDLALQRLVWLGVPKFEPAPTGSDEFEPSGWASCTVELDAEEMMILQVEIFAPANYSPLLSSKAISEKELFARGDSELDERKG